MNYNLVRNLAKQKGLSIREIGEKISMSDAGLYRAFINNSLKVDSLEKIADVLGVSPCYFFQPEGTIQSQSGKIDYLREEVIGKSNVLLNVELLLQEIGKNLKLSEDFVKRVNEDICQKGYEILVESYGNRDNIYKVTRDMAFQLSQIHESAKRLTSKSVDVKDVINSVDREITFLYKQYIDAVTNNSSIAFLREEKLIPDTSLLSSLSTLTIKYIGFKADGISKDYLSKFFNVKDIHDSFKQDMFDNLDFLSLTALRRGAL